MSDGLCFVSVDGVLNPFGAPRNENPEGYETLFRARARHNGYAPAPTWWARPHERGTPVRLNPQHGPMLMSLADRWNLELVWATHWGHDARRLVGPVLGLPEMRVVETYPAMPVPGQCWKAPFVREFAGTQPFVWLDFEFEINDFVWGRARLEERGLPTVQWNVNPMVGLTWQAIKIVDTFLQDQM